MIFANRSDAGERLARALLGLRGERPLVLALPRGGVPVAYEVARALGAPLDVLLARKLGMPSQPEFAIGAVAEGGVLVRNPDAADAGVDEATLNAAIVREQREIDARVQRFRGGRPLPDVRGRTVIVVDDGIATGATARAALRAIKAMRPSKLVLAVPVGAPDTLDAMRDEVDAVVALAAPGDFRAVGCWYSDFDQVSDEAVVDLLARAAAEHRAT